MLGWLQTTHAHAVPPIFSTPFFFFFSFVPYCCLLSRCLTAFLQNHALLLHYSEIWFYEQNQSWLALALSAPGSEQDLNTGIIQLPCPPSHLQTLLMEGNKQTNKQNQPNNNKKAQTNIGGQVLISPWQCAVCEWCSGLIYVCVTYRCWSNANKTYPVQTLCRCFVDARNARLDFCQNEVYIHGSRKSISRIRPWVISLIKVTSQKCIKVIFLIELRALFLHMLSCMTTVLPE